MKKLLIGILAMIGAIPTLGKFLNEGNLLLRAGYDYGKSDTFLTSDFDIDGSLYGGIEYLKGQGNFQYGIGSEISKLEVNPIELGGNTFNLDGATRVPVYIVSKWNFNMLSSNSKFTPFIGGKIGYSISKSKKETINDIKIELDGSGFYGSFVTGIDYNDKYGVELGWNFQNVELEASSLKNNININETYDNSSFFLGGYYRF